MRGFSVFLIISSFLVTGCTPDQGLQSIAQECRSEEASALAAEYPNAALVAQHDQLEREATALQNQAVQAIRSTGNPDAGTADIDQAVQDSEDAAGLYDYQGRQQSALQCWQMLDQVAGDEQAQWPQLQQQNAAADAAAQARADATLEPAYNSQPPPPSPSPLSDLGTPSLPPKTWMDTPYAPIVPPALRTEPIGVGGPAIPPVAQ